MDEMLIQKFLEKQKLKEKDLYTTNTTETKDNDKLKEKDDE